MTVNTKNPPEPKWVRRPQERPDEIMDAAIEVFFKRGYSQSTMDEIAELSGVSKGTVYLYFKSKEELLVKSIEAKITGFQTRALTLFDEAVSGNLDRESLIYLLEASLKMMYSVALSPEMRKPLRIILAERPHNEKLREMHSRLVGRGINRIVSFIEHLTHKGLIECNNPENIAKLILGMIIIFPLTAEITGKEQMEEFSDKEFREIFNFVVQGLGLTQTGGNQL